LLRKRRAFAEEVLLHLLNDHLLVFPAGGVQAVFVQEHLAELRPGIPGILGDIFVDPVSQFRVKRRFITTWELLIQLRAGRLVIAHSNLTNLYKNYLTGEP